MLTGIKSSSYVIVSEKVMGQQRMIILNSLTSCAYCFSSFVSMGSALSAVMKRVNHSDQNVQMQALLVSVFCFWVGGFNSLEVLLLALGSLCQ